MWLSNKHRRESIYCSFKDVKFLLIGLIFFLLTFSCVTKQSTESLFQIDEYYPLKEGYSWTYIEKEYSSGALFSRRIKHRITGVRLDGNNLVFSTNPNGLFAIYDKNGIAKAGAFVVRDNYGIGITVKTKNDLPVYPSRLYYLLKNPLIKGNSWRNHVSIFDIFGQKFEIVDTNAVVELENGLRFEHCIEVLSNYSSEGMRYTGKQWFATDIGLVKSTQWRHHKGKEIIVYELYLIELPEFLHSRPETK